MQYPVNTSAQLRAVLRGLRQNRGLSQTQAGTLIGVSQKRIARIEAKPGVTSFDQIAKLVATLGGRLLLEQDEAASPEVPSRNLGKPRKTSAAKTRAGKNRDTW
jgi:HTH-type transcriptional regulator/antitoxin HipB